MRGIENKEKLETQRTTKIVENFVQSNLAIRAFLVRSILALKVKLLLLSSFKKKFRYLYFRPRKKMKKANTQYF